MNTVTQILYWPLEAYYDVMDDKTYIPPIAAVAAAYYWAGGLPNQGQDSMLLAQAYLMGGVAFVAADMVTGDQPGSNPST